MKAQPMIGERVAVIGAGLIGLLTAQVLSTTGAKVCIVDIQDNRLETALQLIQGIMMYNPRHSSKTDSFGKKRDK
jgi:threonine dehydrogenase-like Zn-dependent dehydrogenase